MLPLCRTLLFSFVFILSALPSHARTCQSSRFSSPSLAVASPPARLTNEFRDLSGLALNILSSYFNTSRQVWVLRDLESFLNKTTVRYGPDNMLWPFCTETLTNGTYDLYVKEGYWTSSHYSVSDRLRAILHLLFIQISLETEEDFSLTSLLVLESKARFEDLALFFESEERSELSGFYAPGTSVLFSGDPSSTYYLFQKSGGLVLLSKTEETGNLTRRWVSASELKLKK